MNFSSRSLFSLSNRLFSWQQDTSRRFMSKYLSKQATKRVPLTSKRARKGFYKGNRSTKEGHVNSKGRFIVDKSKRLELVVPNLEGFALKPYIASTVPKFPPENRLRT